MTSHGVSLTNILIVQHGCCTPKVYEDQSSFYGNHHATVYLLCNTVAIIAILGKVSKLCTLSACAVRDKITSAPPKKKPSGDSVNLVLY